MLFAHSIVGVMPVSNSEFSWFWFIGSVIPDLDHLFVLYKHKLFSWDKIVQAFRFEDRYGIRFKTKYMHSVFGAAVTSIPLIFINPSGALLYFVAYLLHLVLDWPDIDEKQYFYPFEKRIRGSLPIFSKQEIFFTVLLFGLYLYQSGIL